MRSRAALLALAAACAMAPHGAAAEDFYRGKSITLIVGNSAGNGYDQYARLLARHMGKYIPGEPGIVVRNQPGAGGLVMANAMYNTAPRDGLSIGMPARTTPLEPILQNPAARFKAEDFTWLGTASRYDDDTFALVARTDSGVHSIADLGKIERPLIIGGSAEGGSETDVVLIARDVLKLNLQLVRGYGDSRALLVAMESGEIQGRAITFTSIQKAMPEWLAQGRLQPLLQFGHATRWSGLPDVPTARELAATPEDKAVVELVDIPFTMSRPYLAPPDIPADRAAILKQAFMATQTDPDYRREAAAIQLDISPISGDELQSIIARLAQTPATVIARYKAALSAR